MMLQKPIDHPLDLLTQDILTWASWGLTLLILGIALNLSRRERTPFYVLLVLAVMVGAFAEPLYDEGMMLYFYSTAGMYTHFTAFDIPQPVWTHSGYVVLYALPALFIARAIGRGALRMGTLFACAALELTMSCAFEMFGINGIDGGAYAYWGPHVWRIADYPIVIGVLESAQVVAFSVVAALLRSHVRGRLGLGALFVLFPGTFFGANFGAGAPLVVTLHLANGTPRMVALGTVLSIAAALVLIGTMARLLPYAKVHPSRA
jgi:hypothetical protein